MYFHNNKKNLSGFTLIELIMVIIILGTIAISAATRFLNVQSEAKIAKIKAISAAMKSTADLVSAKAIINNVVSGNMDFNGTNISVINGHIGAHWNKSWRYALDIGKEISYTSKNSICTKHSLCGVGQQNSAPALPFVVQSPGKVAFIWLQGEKLADRCYAFYYNPNDVNKTSPEIGTVTSGC
ncbi:type II secretion system GspH family protein [Pseudoalteromonas sp. C2R02]|uniref:type II secretion system protein n=1 Tax=Pseudoalteromonas sp. C2R02 TaxID=2841565 RepID=UPI001C0A4FDC|nr:type II secretion system protein [Pseudoalteromonas sp. C2R02]MBU2971026.1 type II secretion system GspH family protein [Pseudoalteromonas sp. C2R02]